MAQALTDKRKYSVSAAIELRIVARNPSGSIAKLRFDTAQRFDFLIFKAEDMVWRWSRDKLFAMGTSVLEISPHKSVSFSARLPAQKLGRGRYDVIAIVTCDPPMHSECSFEIV